MILHALDLGFGDGRAYGDMFSSGDGFGAGFHFGFGAAGYALGISGNGTGAGYMSGMPLDSASDCMEDSPFNSSLLAAALIAANIEAFAQCED